MLRHAFCLTNGIAATPVQLLLKGDPAFCSEVAGCSLDELNAFADDGLHLTFFQGASI